MLTEHSLEGLQLSPQQKHLWLLQQDGGEWGAFCVVRLTGPLNLRVLEESVDTITERHEIFRTTFHRAPGLKVPLQRIHCQASGSWQYCDLRGRDPLSQSTELRRLRDEIRVCTVDLQTLPLLRVTVVACSDEQHWVLISLPSLCADVWTFKNFVHEMHAGYQACLDGKPEHADSVQYGQFSEWQHALLEDEEAVAGHAYWHRQDLGSFPRLVLPFEQALLDTATWKMDEGKFDVSAPLFAHLQVFAKQSHSTLRVVVLTSWYVLLWKLTGEDELVVATRCDGRSDEELYGGMGLFAKWVPQRQRLSSQSRLRDLLNRVGTSVEAGELWQDYFVWGADDDYWQDLAKEWYGFEYVEYPEPQTAGGVSFAIQEDCVCFDRLKLKFTCVQGPQSLQVTVRYDRRRFSSQAVDCLLDQFETVLTSVVHHPNARVEQINILSDGVREQALLDWNATTTSEAPGRCLHEFIEAQVVHHPSHVAVMCQEASLTYAELNARANQVAWFLRRQGVRPLTLVGLWVERSVDMLVGLLGIWKAGAAYVPFDPHVPIARLHDQLTQLDVRYLITQEAQLSHGLHFSGVVVCLDRDRSSLEQEAIQNLNLRLSPDYLAYVMYTSGSTGKPKGVATTHRNIVHYTSSVSEALSIGEGWKFATVSTLSADLGNTGVFSALVSGGTLHVLTYELAMNGRAFAEYVATHEIDVLKIVPSHLQALVRATDQGRIVPKHCLIFGGEALSVEWATRCMEQANGCVVINHYGPTETTIGALMLPLPYQALGESGGTSTVPLGRPLGNTEAFILDAHLEPVAIGMKGELYLGGMGLAWGYLNQPAQTAPRFIPHPYAPQPGARLYKTGDLARYRPDGTIEFLGRCDHQVKIRGYRIELGEVEACLVEHPEIEAAVVLARASQLEELQLVAYVVGRDGEPPFADVRECVAARLSEYMMPSQWVTVEKLPLTANGKVDRQALLIMEGTGVGLAYVAPRTPTEEVVAEIWAEVLGVEKVGVHDNFFELGGHSLLAVTLIDRMRQAGVPAMARSIFLTPTVAGLAEAINPAGEQIDIPPNGIPADCDVITPAMLPLVTLTPDHIAQIVQAVPGGARNIQDIYPLAPLQEGILFHHLLDRTGDPYLRWNQLHFDTRERLDGFRRTLQLVINRHDILRTAIWWESLREPVQVVWREAPVSFEELSFVETEGDIEQQLHAHYDPRHYRIDVRQAPLIRGGVVQDPTTGQWWLEILWHNLIGDHMTLDILLSEIEAIQQGQEAQLSTPVPFRNFIAHTRHGLHAVEHEVFFREMLGDTTEPTALFGLLNIRDDGLVLEEAQRRIDPILEKHVRQCSRRLGVSTASVLHLAWAHVVSRISGQQQVVFGTVLLGRMHGEEGVDRSPGLFMNTLPILIDVGEQGVADSIREAHALLTRLLAHEHVPLTVAQRCSGVGAHAPVFSSILNYRHNPKPGPDGQSSSKQAWAGIEALERDERTNFPVNMHIDDDGESLEMTAQIATQGQASRVCEYMHTVLENIVSAIETAPATPIRDIELLSTGDRRQLLEEWNTTGQEWGEEAQSVVELFEAQAARAPDAVAVVWGEELVSYRELNDRANAVASTLRTLGVGPEVLVGLCVERSVEMIAILLGVWKAGGAYVPLDPSYPQARIAYILEDAHPAVLLTQQSLFHTLPPSQAQVLCVDEDGIFSSECSPEYVLHLVRGQQDSMHTAYVIYTSGSTGQPKGVMISHHSARNFLAAMREHLQPTEHDRLLAVTSLSFDISLLELILPLLVGARVVLADTETAQDGLRLRHRVETSGMTMMQATPATWRMLIEAGWSGQSGVQVLCGGEALSMELAEALVKRDVLLWNVYGPTETTVWSTIQRVHQATGPIPIGKPITNTQTYVLDSLLQPVPIGVSGELYIGGEGVARGYWNRPGLTAERFVPNPFNPQGGARLYRTGDVVRHRLDGAIEYVGRIDHQVKVRGYRIELGEIEATLGALPEIHEAVVIAREGQATGTQLVGYVVPTEGSTLDFRAVKDMLAARLPGYMVPTQWVELEKLPLTSNGKIDRKALLELEGEGLATEYVAPRTPSEELLVTIWAEVLGVERVGIHDDFFDLGGHSLLAMRVVSRVRDECQVKVDLMDFFMVRTVAELSVVVDKAEKALSESDAKWMTELLDDLD